MQFRNKDMNECKQKQKNVVAPEMLFDELADVKTTIGANGCSVG